MISPRPRTDALGSGERFKGAKYQPSQIRTISRSGEKGGGGKPMQEQRIMKGFSSTKAKSVVQPKPIRTFGNSKRGLEKQLSLEPMVRRRLGLLQGNRSLNPERNLLHRQVYQVQVFLDTKRHTLIEGKTEGLVEKIQLRKILRGEV